MPHPPSNDESSSGPAPMEIEELAARTDKPAWMIARGVARLISRGLLSVEGGSKEDAIAKLQAQYGEAVNGR